MLGMAKKETTVNVQARLTTDEVKQLDAAAAAQAVPVTRAQLIAHVLREWINRKGKR
jgi:hypothetical protein